MSSIKDTSESIKTLFVSGLESVELIKADDTIVEQIQILNSDKKADGPLGKEDPESPKRYIDTTGEESKAYAFLPMLIIDNYTIPPLQLDSFNLDCRGFVPVINVRVNDNHNTIRNIYRPVEGSIIKLYIASVGEEETYRPIRADFIITNITYSNPIMMESLIISGSSQITMTAQLHVPELFYNKTYVDIGTSYTAMMNIASELGLGFVSNIEDTNDSQTWIGPYMNAIKYINNICSASYVDEDSALVSFIDVYRNINLIEVNRLYNVLEDPPRYRMYKNIFLQDDAETTEEKNRPADNNPNDTLTSRVELLDSIFSGWDYNSRICDYEITNTRQMNGWNIYFDKYKIVENPGSMVSTGYKNMIKWFDYYSDEYKTITYVPHSFETNGLMPLNRGKLDRGTPTELSKNMISYVDTGLLSGTHKNYNFAQICNNNGIAETSKHGLIVEMPCVNFAIKRYSRIKVSVFEKLDSSQDDLREDVGAGEIIEGKDGIKLSTDKYRNLQSKVTPQTKTNNWDDYVSGIRLGTNSKYELLASPDRTEDGEDPNQPNTSTVGRETIIESLSGFYVVTGYELFVDQTSVNGPTLRQRVYLSRKEWKPSLKEHYMDLSVQ